jgi:hypothetical protein
MLYTIIIFPYSFSPISDGVYCHTEYIASGNQGTPSVIMGTIA